MASKLSVDEELRAHVDVWVGIAVGQQPAVPVQGLASFYRARIDAVVGGYIESAFGAVDYEFWLRLHLVTRFERVVDMLYRYCVHDNTLTAR
jgi:hypothetical protein